MPRRQGVVRSSPKLFYSNYRPPVSQSHPTAQTPGKVRWKVPVAVLLLFLLGYGFIHLPYFAIKHVELTGSQDPAIVESLQALKGRSIFSRSISHLPSTLLNQNLTLANLSCQRGLPDTIRCSVVTRQPSLIWQVNGKNYFVDDYGFLYAPATDGPHLPVVTDTMNVKVDIGSAVSSSALVKFVRGLSEGLIANQITVNSISVADSLYQYNVSYGSPARTAYFSATESLSNQMATFLAARSQKGASVTDHIDLRVPGYVYWK